MPDPVWNCQTCLPLSRSCDELAGLLAGEQKPATAIFQD
jgi:hypothetical protein